MYFYGLKTKTELKDVIILYFFDIKNQNSINFFFVC